MIYSYLSFDTLQKNIGVKESNAEADKAVEKLTEMINGFSKGQNDDDNPVAV